MITSGAGTRALGQLPRPPIDAGEYPRVPLLLTGCFSLYLLVWYLEFNKRFDFLGTIRFEFLLGAALAIAAIASIAGRTEANRSRLTKYICLYFAFLVCHLPVSEYPEVSWTIFVDRIVKFSCVALFTYAFVRSPRTLRIFMAILLLAWLKIGQEAFVGRLTGSMIWENQGVMRLNGTPGTRLSSPNSLSGFAVCTIPFLYYLFPIVGRKSKACLLLLFVFALNMIVFAGSRTGYLATIGLIGFLWLRSARKGRFLGGVVLAATLGLPFLPAQYEARFMTAFVGEEAEGHSKGERIEIANDAWQLFREHPLGLGIYGFRYAREQELGKTQMDTHNLYLQILVDMGVVGTVVFGLLVVGMWRELRATDIALGNDEQDVREALNKAERGRAAEIERHLSDIQFMRATANAFLAFLFTRLALGVFGHDLYEIYWWLAAGGSIAIVNMQPVVSARTATIVAEASGGSLETEPLRRPRPTSSKVGVQAFVPQPGRRGTGNGRMR